eukprot:Lankesteria_metandrocarpae@DN3987_c0_g1_i2.p1
MKATSYLAVIGTVVMLLHPSIGSPPGSPTRNDLSPTRNDLQDQMEIYEVTKRKVDDIEAQIRGIRSEIPNIRDQKDLMTIYDTVIRLERDLAILASLTSELKP